jgi:hypothetical protein
MLTVKMMIRAAKFLHSSKLVPGQYGGIDHICILRAGQQTTKAVLVPGRERTQKRNHAGKAEPREVAPQPIALAADISKKIARPFWAYRRRPLAMCEMRQRGCDSSHINNAHDTELSLFLSRQNRHDTPEPSNPFNYVVMANFGFSPTDIANGIILAKRICEAHFVRERRAGKFRTP